MFEVQLPIRLSYKGYDIVTDYLDEPSQSSIFLTSVQRPSPDAPSFQFTSDCPVRAELLAKLWIDRSLVDLD